MDTNNFFRKPFSVEAINVTAENIIEAAAWCDGKVHTDPHGSYIRVQVHKPMSNRQTKAYIGDWILKSQRGYKVYTDAAFTASFLKDDNGVIHKQWDEIVTNVFEEDSDDYGADIGPVVSENDQIAGKR